MSKQFKAGDKVYYPIQSTEVLTIHQRDDSDYPVLVDFGGGHTYTFTLNGKTYDGDVLPSIFHATPEIQAKLEDFYGVEFEAPPAKPSSSDIIQAMLTKGNKYIPCWVSDEIKEPDSSCAFCLIINYYGENTKFPFRTGYMAYRFATPFDPVTGEAITELPE